MDNKNKACIPVQRNAGIELQQPIALRPFVGKFVFARLIAFRASQNQIPRVIGTPLASNRDKVINMISIFALIELFGAPITLAILSFMLTLHILPRVLAWKTFFLHLPRARVSTIRNFTLFCLPVFPGGCAPAFWVSSVLTPTQFAHTFWILLAPYLITCRKTLRFQNLPPCVGLIADFFLVLSLIASILFFQAWFAVSKKLVFGLAIQTKKLTGSREKFAAFCAAFLRDGVIHEDLNGLSSSTLSFCCQRNKAIPFSSGLITPSLGNTINYTFFPNTREAEGANF